MLILLLNLNLIMKNIKIKQASPYTLNIDINGPFAIKAITKNNILMLLN